MLNRLSPQQFNEWRQYYLREPWGDDWQQAGTIAAALHNEFLLLTQMLTGLAGGPNKKNRGDRFVNPDDYIPKLRKSKKLKKTNPRDTLAWGRSIAGL